MSLRQCVFAAGLVVLGGISVAGEQAVSPADRTAVVGSLAQQIRDNYVFPKIGLDLAARLEAKARK